MNEPCENMPEQIADYLLGALDEQGRQAVASHLETCPACRAYLQALQDHEQTLVALGEQIAAGMDEREERVLEAVNRPGRRHRVLPWGKWAVAAALIMASGIAIGRFTSPRPIDAERLKAEVQRAVLADVNRRVNTALAKAADQTAEDMRIMATQLAAGSKAMMNARLAELIDLIETARRTDRQRVADALMQIELSRQDDRNQIAASLRSLATPAAELSVPDQQAPTSTNN